MIFSTPLLITLKIYLTSMNQTTNENTKWGDVKHWYKKQQKRYAKSVKEGRRKQEENSNAAQSSTDYPRATPDLGDGDVTCTPGTQSTQPETDSNENTIDLDFFDPGPIPKNLYDRGFVENWKEVLFPMSKRKNALQLGGYTKPRGPAPRPPRTATSTSREIAGDSTTSGSKAKST
jgi:hypothetical protein